ncbi:MAG: 3-oxoacyl-ACP reductase FabG [Cyclobacteriaceae bacterium]|nr:3-oxoacyl-ACP reductase FabG [Cyclobacteriaceae bacterium]
MDIRFDDKVVLVTGASSGIGRATAVEFAKAGARVVVHYNESQEAAEKAVQVIRDAGGEAVAIQADVSRKDEVIHLVDECLNIFGTIDILINNAGSLIKRESLETMPEDLWDRVLDVNLKSIFLVSQAVIPIMKNKNYGKIVNLTSIAARVGGGVGAGHYSASKGAILTLTKNMARELAPFNIHVNALSPGIIETRFHERFTTPEIFEKFKEQVVLKRAGTAEECAFPILFLASDFASYILGETIEVNGGQLMD